MLLVITETLTSHSSTSHKRKFDDEDLDSGDDEEKDNPMRDTIEGDEDMSPMPASIGRQAVPRGSDGEVRIEIACLDGLD